MAFRYDTSSDALQQLDGCVMLTDKGEVIKLSYVEGWDYEVKNLTKRGTEILDIREVGLTFNALSLGYINHRYGLAYAVRNPIRMWKAGVTRENTKAIRGSISDGVMSNNSLANCILNIYPTIEEAYTEASRGAKEIAFHKDFAFSMKNYPKVGIEYKGIDIGFVNDKQHFEIEEKYIYLKEVLEEIVNGKG